MAVFIKLVLFLTVFLVVDYCQSDSLIIGNVTGRLVYVDNIKRSSIPMKVRTKSIFYNGDQPIKVCFFYFHSSHAIWLSQGM